MASQIADSLAKREEIWGSGAGAAKVLTTGFVSTDTFKLVHKDVVALEIAISGTAPTTLHLKLEVSFDNGTNYNIVEGFSDYQLDGATAAHFKVFKLLPHGLYRLSAKRTGGDGTTATLIFGSSLESEHVGNLSISALGAMAVEGDVAHDAADAGNPVKTGFRARTSQIAAVANNDRSDAISNAYGEQVVAGYDWTNDAVKGDTAFVAGTATNVNGGNRDAGTQTVTLADDDPAVVDLAAIEVLQTTIAGDTTSIDGKTPALGTAAMVGSVPVTVATDDTQFGAVGAAADVDGNIHGQLRFIGEAVDGLEADLSTVAGDTTSIDGKTPALGTALMAGSVPVTLATDDTQFGAVGAAADVDGDIHGQLRYIGEAVDGLEADTAVMAGWDNAASDGASVSGDVAHDAIDAGEPVKIGHRARTSQIAAVANNDRSDSISNAYGELVIAGHDWVTGSNAVEVNNPDSERYAFETIANVNPATTNTTYDYFIDMSGYQYLTIQWAVTSPGADTNTIKLYGTVLDDGTAPGSIAAADWQDITQYGFNISTAASTSASYVDTNAIVTIIPGFNYKYVHVENVISNGASNDSTHKIIIKKWY